MKRKIAAYQTAYTEGSNMTRLANVNNVLRAAAMAAVLTAAGWSVGSATAPAAPHPDPHAGPPTVTTPTAGKPPKDTPPTKDNGFKGLLIVSPSGTPLGFIPPGAENVGEFIHLIVQCHARHKEAPPTDTGIRVLVCG